LKGRQRQICDARMAGQKNEQICEALHLTPIALAVHVCRAKATLSRILNLHESSGRRKPKIPSPCRNTGDQLNYYFPFS
jgi:hypothetical protein